MYMCAYTHVLMLLTKQFQETIDAYDFETFKLIITLYLFCSYNSYIAHYLL